jgi:ferredoxin-NADP reductase
MTLMAQIAQHKPDHRAGQRFHVLRVAAVISETTDCVSIALEVPPKLSFAFSYEAGQVVYG